MPGTTRLFGLILIALGVVSYVWTGRTSVTALIPALFGAVLLVCAIVARANEGARKHAMHAAVAVGLIGAIAALARGIPAALVDASRPAVMSQLAMGVLLLIYVALGVQSFISARRARTGR
ncbi:MAG: hypothetical protein K2Y23_15840 [Cyanobacteria bacterium]|nr:hypothetical protein [Cyanobacteriota bacterium]